MEQQLTPLEALELAVRIAGGQSALARICNVGQPAVWKWLQSSKRLPAGKCIAVEDETGVSRHYLRPDIYPIDTAAFPASAVGEEVPLCMPILSARILGKHGNRDTNLPKSGKAA